MLVCPFRRASQLPSAGPLAFVLETGCSCTWSASCHDLPLQQWSVYVVALGRRSLYARIFTSSWRAPWPISAQLPSLGSASPLPCNVSATSRKLSLTQPGNTTSDLCLGSVGGQAPCKCGLQDVGAMVAKAAKMPLWRHGCKGVGIKRAGCLKSTLKQPGF